MQIVTLADAPGYDSERIVARPFLDATHGNVRVIRLSPGQAHAPFVAPLDSTRVVLRQYPSGCQTGEACAWLASASGRRVTRAPLSQSLGRARLLASISSFLSTAPTHFGCGASVVAYPTQDSHNGC